MTDATIGLRQWFDKMFNKNVIKKKQHNTPRAQKMTVEQLRTFKGFEACHKEKAQKIIQELEKYARVIIRHITTKK